MRVGFQISALTHRANQEAVMGSDSGIVHISPGLVQSGFHLTRTTQSLQTANKSSTRARIKVLGYWDIDGVNKKSAQ